MKTTFSRRAASINHLVMSAFDPVLGEGGPDSTAFGTPYRDTWMDAILRDDAGRFYWVLRANKSVARDKERILITQSSDDGPYLKLTEKVSTLDFTMDPNTGSRYVTTDPNGPKALVTFTDKEAYWKEEGEFELRGTLAQPGVQMTFPVRRNGSAATQTYYNHQYLVEGTFRGIPVKGHILYEHHYDTVSWIESTLATGYGGMMFFGNEFDDGSTEGGIIYCGGDGLLGAVVVAGNGDEILNTTDVRVQNTLTKEGVFTEALYSFGDGTQRKFEWHPGAAFKKDLSAFVYTNPPDKGFSAVSWGTFTRVGETRKRRRGWAYGQAEHIW